MENSTPAGHLHPTHTAARLPAALRIAALLVSSCFLLLPGFAAGGDAETANAEWPGEELIERVAAAHWAEPRGYHMADSPEERREQIARDLRFDAWLLEHHCPGLTAPEWLDRMIAERERELESEAALIIARENVDPDEEDTERIIGERNLRRTIPGHYNFSYILLEVPGDATDEQRAAKRALGEEIAGETEPANFAEMARLWSDAPSAVRGGHVGSMPLERLGEYFSAAVRDTEPGTVGGPYEHPSGFVIVHVQSASEARPFLTEERIPSVVEDTLANEWLAEKRQSGETWQAFLDEYGVMERDFVQGELAAYRNYLLAHECMVSMAREEEAPEDEELEEFYERQARLYERRFRYFAREIVVSGPDWTREQTREGWEARRAVRDRAREIRQEILDGLPFEEAARQYSISATAEDGGELGWIEPPTQAVLDRALAGLEPGGVSAPLERRDGFWLIHLEEKEEQQPPSFEEMRPQLVREWNARRARELREKLMAEFDDV